MDYEKKYKNALEWARQVINVETGFIRKEVEEIFPELKEDEEERIRKWCISHFKECFRVTKDNVEYQEYLNNKVIPWLEKQGNPTEINPSEFDLRLNKLLKQFIALPKEELESSLSFYLNVIQNDGTYKNEKPFDYENCNIPQHDFAPKSAMEAIKEEKVDNANKAKPMFHKGDWVVCEVTGLVYQIKDCIENLNNHKYGYDLTNGGYIGSDEVNHYHLWSIEDAKDGDVLANKNGAIFINAGSSNGGRGTLDCYCYLSVQNEFCIEEHKTGSWLYKDDIKPATKEQRKLLLQKMKEAGWSWNPETKELSQSKETFGDVEQKVFDELLDNGEQMWSEEDETGWTNTMIMIKECAANHYTKDSITLVIDWLESLKQRLNK